MKVVLTLIRQGQKIEELVEIPGINIEDRPGKLLDAARKFVAPRNTGRPSWDPVDKLLAAKFVAGTP